MSEVVAVAPTQEILGPKTFHDFFRDAMLNTLLAAEFGTYCHDGGDLVVDTLKAVKSEGLSREDLTHLLDGEWDLGLTAERIIAEYERVECDYCTGDESDDTYYDHVDIEEGDE